MAQYRPATNAATGTVPTLGRRIHRLVRKIVLQTGIFLVFWLLKRQYHQIGKEFQESVILRFTFGSKALWNPPIEKARKEPRKQEA